MNNPNTATSTLGCGHYHTVPVRLLRIKLKMNFDSCFIYLCNFAITITQSVTSQK